MKPRCYYLAALVLALPFVLQAATPKSSVEQTMDKIAAAFQKKTHMKDVVRPRSFRREDWPKRADLIISQRDKLPILGQPSLTDRKLNILGFAKHGEFFQSLGCQEIVKLFNPLGGVNDSGIWCHVRLLDGKSGWLLAKASQSPVWYLASAPNPRIEILGMRPVVAAIVIIVLIILFANLLPSRSQSSTATGNSYGDGRKWNSIEGTDSHLVNRDDSFPSTIPDLLRGRPSFDVKEYAKGVKHGKASKDDPVRLASERALLPFFVSGSYLKGHHDGAEDRDSDPDRKDH